jgi:hypothetical protein
LSSRPSAQLRVRGRDPPPLAFIGAEGICNTAKTRVRAAAMSAIALTLGSRLGGRDDADNCSDSSKQQRCLQTYFRILATCCARVVQERCPSEKRGRREDRVRAAPAVSCAKVTNRNAHEHTGSAETLRPSLRNGVTAYSVLSPVRPELVCHRRPQEARAPCELDTCHWGVRTTRLRRTLRPRSSVAAFASIAPRPNVSDDGQRPLSRNGMARNKQVIWVRSQG